ncbi:MAG TPA: chemotaxis protein CheA [Firmicutes bacterium]|nr:chemotaxis protein CheA [Bacillales bacterium]HJA40956.1 chemotaxis protein CheA [Bacillota bacterium]
MDVNQYLELFLEESREHLQNINEQLLLFEKNTDDLGIINEIFRSAHTLKGMAASMSFEDLTNLTHKMENVLDAIRNQKVKADTSLIDVILEAVDHMEEMITDISTGGQGSCDVSDVVDKLLKIEAGESPASISNSKPLETSASPKNDAVKLLDESPFEDYEGEVIKQGLQQGNSLYQIQVKLVSSCVLKAVRVYMIFEAIEEHGEVIKSLPPAQDLEEEKFDTEFTLYLLTKSGKDALLERLNKISEIEEIKITKIDLIADKKSEKVVVEAAAEAVAVSAPPEMPVQEVKTVEQSSPLSTAQSTPPKSKEATEKAISKPPASKTIRVNIDRLDILMNLFEELVVDRGRLEQIANELNHVELNETVERMSRTTGDLQNIILNMRMVPIETVFNRFPRMVRQLAKDLGKKIELKLVGAETELDRTVIDEIGDPLVHLLRNAADHGLESPEERQKIGKNPIGTITLRAYHSGNHVFIEVEDDGHGLSREKILKKAVSNGVLSEKNAAGLTDKQVYQLIFASGFSTAEKVSDVSGRGVGLDVVTNTINSLGGSISIDSELGKGSIFSVQLPLTLSIISVMLVELGSGRFAIPLSSVIETAIIKRTDMLNAHSQKVIDFRGKIVPLLFLKDIFEIEDTKENKDFYSVILVRKGEKIAGLVVDSFIGQQEIVLKSLGDYLQNIFAISGSTILGDGEVALIIDCNALIK